MMFKHILLLIGLSVAAIFFQNQLLDILHFLMNIHNQIASGLGSIFSFSSVGEVVQSVFTLLLIPVVIGVIIAVAHFFIKQQQFPHTMHVIWVCWAVMLAAIVSQTGHVSNQSAQEIQSARQLAQAAKVVQQKQEAAAADKDKSHW